MESSAVLSLEPLSLDGGAGSIASTSRSPQGLSLSTERANQVIHGGGVLLSLLAAKLLLDKAPGDLASPQFIGCLIYSVTLVALYIASTLSHSFSDPVLRARFRMLDQMCIFIHFAGSYTPFALVHLRDGAWPFLMGVMWVVPCAGALARMRSGNSSIATRAFLVIGWIPIVVLPRVYLDCGACGLGMIAGEALAFTGGTWFLSNDQKHPAFHPIWHLCTLAGSAFHVAFLHRFVAGWPL